MKNLKYLAVGIVMGYVLRYVYNLTNNKKTKNHENFFSSVSEIEVEE